MAEALKILGQQAPATGYTAGTMFTVAASHSYVVSKLVAANTSGATRLVRAYARVAGAAVAVGNAVAYDVQLLAGETVVLGEGMVFAATDVLTVASDLGGVTFTAYGSDVS